MTPYEALYGRPCRSLICWTEVGQRSIIGPDLIRDTSKNVDLIRKRLLTTQSRYKSYADRRRRPLEFEVSDHVFLKTMPKRGVVSFGKRGKLAPRYIEPFEILEKVGTFAYCDAPIPRVPLTTRQLVKTCGYRVSQYHTHLSQYIETYFCIFNSQIYKNI